MNPNTKFNIACYCLVLLFVFLGLFLKFWKQRENFDGWFWAAFGVFGCVFSLILILIF